MEEELLLQENPVLQGIRYTAFRYSKIPEDRTRLVHEAIILNPPAVIELRAQPLLDTIATRAMGHQPSKPVVTTQRTSLLYPAAALVASVYLYRRFFVSPQITLYVPPFKVPFEIDVWAPNPEPMYPPPYAAHGQLQRATAVEKTDPLSREISALLSSTTPKSPIDRKELFPTPDDWLLFDIANERLITSKNTSKSVIGGSVYLVVSSMAAAENKLHEIVGKYIAEEVVRKAKDSNGYLAALWEKVSVGRKGLMGESAAPVTTVRSGE
ncbi:hypothetical protein K440DRAFT_664917 [Wilcoxina mikolae CBS 423.85]|nr:hypothetical protein K440DRAFT_664917 [Wilcoxina mikolae CBS 423.85]